MVDCSSCGRAFETSAGDQPVALISVEVMGDEYTESFFCCDACGVYTQESHRDRFLGEESVRVYGPIAKAVGDAAVASIRRCPEPTNKRCRCAAHLQFGAC